jgi:phage terminase small subunit
MTEQTERATARPALTPRRWEFVRQYVALNNGSAAARRAGYSERSASSEASRLLKNDEVVAAVEWYRASEAERLGVTAERVLAELAAIAFADLGDYVRVVKGVPVLDMSELPAGATRAIASIDETSSGGVRFKLHDKQAALVTLARSFGLLGSDSPAVAVVVGAAESVELSTLTADQLRAGILALSGGAVADFGSDLVADSVDLVDLVDSGEDSQGSQTFLKNTAMDESSSPSHH